MDIEYCPKCEVYHRDGDRLAVIKLNIGDQVTVTHCAKCRPAPLPLEVQLDIWKSSDAAKHGSFVAAFAMAMMHADPCNAKLLEPVSLMLIEKYALVIQMAL